MMKSIAIVDDNYNNERKMFQHEILERNLKSDKMLEEKRTKEKRMEL